MKNEKMHYEEYSTLPGYKKFFAYFHFDKNMPYEDYKKLPWYKKIFFRTIKHFATVDEAYGARPMKWLYNLIFIAVIVALLLYFGLDINFFSHFRNPNWSKFGDLLRGFATPNLEYFFGYGANFTFQTSVIYQVIETFAIAFIGTTIASLLSLIFGFLASRRIVGRWAIISEIFLITIRTFPEILLGFILVKAFGFGPLSGVAVLSIHSVGMIGKMYAEQLDVIDNNPIEALSACGAGSLTRIKLGVIPQVAPNFLSVILYRFDLNIRTASLLGLVGAGGVGYPIQVYGDNQHWSMLASVLYGVIILVLIVDLVSSQLRKKLI
ncbi:MAG: phosphonate ABC transporter, permease protein PhnE [Bacilli bacterium]|jgi:phosphonate transport system permease protein